MMNNINCKDCVFWTKVTNHEFSEDYGVCEGIQDTIDGIDIDIKGDAIVDKIETKENFGCKMFEKK